MRKFLSEEEAISSFEYAVLLALLAIVIVGAVKFLGTQASTTFSTAAEPMWRESGHHY